MSHDTNFDASLNAATFGALAVPTYYRVLNVDHTASRMMIREAYLRLKNLYQNGSDGLYGMGDINDMQAQAAELEEAFSTLNDDQRRAEYDRTIGVAQPVKAQVAASPSSHAPVGHNETFASGQADTIQTSRSTLKVIKTRAIRSEDPQTQEKFLAVLAEADLGDGALLLKIRQMVGVTDVEIQERTKISLEYIRAMENNRFDRLPQVVYVKGFMRSYLKYLCVPNSEAIIAAFAARLEAWQQGLKQ